MVIRSIRKMSDFSLMKDVHYISDLFHKSFGIPTHFIDTNGNIIKEYSAIGNNPLYASKETLLQQINSQKNIYNFPLFRTTKFLEAFFIINLKEGHTFHGSIVVGPTIQTEPTEGLIDRLLQDLHIMKKENVLDYYLSVPMYSSLQFINASAQMYYMIYRERIDPSKIYDQNKIYDQRLLELDNTDVEIAKIRQGDIQHFNPFHEKIIMQCVKEGKKEELMDRLKIYKAKTKEPILSKHSYLRSQKNTAIATITLVTRSATDGGLPPEIAFTLSDLYIQSLEELQDQQKVTTLLINAIYDFTERVQKSKSQNYSKPIIVATGFIFNNLYNENLNVQLIADKAAMHPNYLAKLFKKETKCTIHEYIQMKKVEEAKLLIAHSGYSLTDIYTLLNFYDQSHFTKIFKSIVGVTPNTYKKHHKSTQQKTYP